IPVAVGIARVTAVGSGGVEAEAVVVAVVAEQAGVGVEGIMAGAGAVDRGAAVRRGGRRGGGGGGGGGRVGGEGGWRGEGEGGRGGCPRRGGGAWGGARGGGGRRRP